MGIVGHGIDLLEVARIGRMRSAHGEHFLNRCFTAAERDYCQSKNCADEHLAGRFAAKEAVLKALGTGWRGHIAWTDMEILNDAAGKPVLRLTGETARLAAAAGIARWHISITHTTEYAMASAIGEAPSD